MVSRIASVPGYCCWLAAVSFAALSVPAFGQAAGQAQTKSSFAGAAKLRSLDGLSIVPTWSDTGQSASDSRVNVRVLRVVRVVGAASRSRGGADDFIEFDIKLRSLPDRTDGPDNDRAGADAREVRLRSARLLLGDTVAAEVSRFEHWYDNSDADARDVSVEGSKGRALYTEARREYIGGRPGPAYFASRCLLRLPLATVATALRKTGNPDTAPRSPLWRLLLSTDAGEMVVPLTGERAARIAEERAGPPSVPVLQRDVPRTPGRIRIWN